MADGGNRRQVRQIEARVEAAVRAMRADRPELVATRVPLCDLTTFRIGGPALGLCRLTTPEVARRFHRIALAHDLPCFCLGGGSNVLVDDAGFCGLILKMEIDHLEFADTHLTVGAGFSFDGLIERSLAAGLVGLEFASGIPGTVGGAVVGNAGCYGHEIAEFVTAATVLRPDGNLEHLGPAELGFAYRETSLKRSGHLLLDVTLALVRGDAGAATRIRAEKIADRWRKHPTDLPCAGSYFRNLPPAGPGGPRRAAGRLLEEAGAKRLRVGDAGVFERHANIIVNHGRATCAEVLELAAAMREAVRRDHGVMLEPEVQHLSWLAGA